MKKENRKEALLFVLDRSGSMSWGMNGNDRAKEGERRIDIAKKTLTSRIQTMPDNVPMGLILLPSPPDRSCHSEIIFDVQPGHKEPILDIVELVKAPWTPNLGSKGSGGTPLALGLALSAGIAKKSIYNINVIVLSDGEENCGGDTLRIVSEASEALDNFNVSTIGISLDEFSREELCEIALEGRGNYFDANDVRQIEYAVQQTTRMIEYIPQTPASKEISKISGKKKMGIFSKIKL
ncbi:MAG: VWA domain-containing protein [Desulfobacterales bacterium]|nr:VWA domain-containing protein [Desulfobacterales bacterium]